MEHENDQGLPDPNEYLLGRDPSEPDIFSLSNTSSMSNVKRIEGFVEKRAVTWFGNDEPRNASITLRALSPEKQFHPAPAVLFIGDTEAPKVFTHDQVKALVNDIVQVQHDIDRELELDRGVDFLNIARKHGISLAP